MSWPAKTYNFHIFAMQNLFNAVNPATIMENKNLEIFSETLFLYQIMIILMMFNLSTPLTSKACNTILSAPF